MARVWDLLAGILVPGAGFGHGTRISRTPTIGRSAPTALIIGWSQVLHGVNGVGGGNTRRMVALLLVVPADGSMAFRSTVLPVAFPSASH